MTTSTDQRFPPLTAEFDGLVLRPFIADDAEAVRVACSDPETQRWILLPNPYTMDDAVAWTTTVAPILRENGDGLHQALVTRDGEFIGSMTLTRTNWRFGVTEVGYWTAPWARGRGHTTAAVRFLSRWAFEQGMGRVELYAAVDNTASRRVAEKTGFVFEGIKRSGGLLHDGRVDLAQYSLIPTDLEAAQ